jgi:hypothetical protein
MLENPNTYDLGINHSPAHRILEVLKAEGQRWKGDRSSINPKLTRIAIFGCLLP